MLIKPVAGSCRESQNPIMRSNGFYGKQVVVGFFSWHKPIQQINVSQYILQIQYILALIEMRFNADRAYKLRFPFMLPVLLFPITTACAN